jgi:hypothetical protein
MQLRMKNGCCAALYNKNPKALNIQPVYMCMYVCMYVLGYKTPTGSFSICTLFRVLGSWPNGPTFRVEGQGFWIGVTFTYWKKDKRETKNKMERRRTQNHERMQSTRWRLGGQTSLRLGVERRCITSYNDCMYTK